ncbi:hypothetical protein B0I37DRAFT_95877 [Chaetomium sp. MPI-CAGE-AT-0009]|nr:hypothetical protein B0I37DRAFT_95877 [Chaetomium sp. MPI-CAGE-AT-0009]
MLRESQSGSHERAKKGSMVKVADRESDLQDPRCPEIPPTMTWEISFPKTPVPAAEPQECDRCPGQAREARTLEKVCSPNPRQVEDSAHSTRWTQWADLGPLFTSPWGSCMPSLYTDVSQASSAPMLSPPFRDRQCPFPISCTFGCALSRDAGAAAGCRSKYACQCCLNIDGLHTCRRVPFGATAATHLSSLEPVFGSFPTIREASVAPSGDTAIGLYH